LKAPNRKTTRLLFSRLSSELMDKAGYGLTQLDAVVVTAGPGSYTGLRVGLASAKGICYALGKPLILINTLEVMAQAVLSRHLSIDPSAIDLPFDRCQEDGSFYGPLRLSLHEIEPPHALVVDENSFCDLENAIGCIQRLRICRN
jgi:tRNA threonylcarbamoyladenosine biosynthesis protein TsaB